MVDLAEQLRRYGEAVEEQANLLGETAHQRAPRRHAGRVLSAAAAACALVVGSVAAWTALEGTPSEDVRTEASPVPAEVSAGVRLNRSVPLSAREDAAVVAADDLIVVWGGSIEGSSVGRPELGSDTYSDGAFLDSEESWHLMTPSPLPDDGSRPVAVWTGEVVLVFRGPHAAAWDPTSNTWTGLPSPPATVTRAFFTGELVIAMGANATYRIGDTRWEAMPAGPIEVATESAGGVAVAAASTGDELVIVDKSTSGLVTVAAYDPLTRRWRTFPGHDLGPGSESIGVTWTGEEIIVMGNENVSGPVNAVDSLGLAVVALNTQSGEWRTLPPLMVLPGRGEGVPLLAAVDDTVVAHRGGSAGILADGEWTVFQGHLLPSAQPVEGADDTVLYFGLNNVPFGGVEPEGSALGILEPQRFVDAARRDAGATTWSDDHHTDEPLSPTTTIEIESPSDLDNNLAEAIVSGFLRLANGPSEDAVEGLPFAEEVRLGVGGELYQARSRDQLADPAAWVIDVREFRALSGSFSALELAAGAQGTVVSVGEHAHCAGPPVSPPPDVAGLARVSVQPDVTGESCIMWWTVDFFVNAGGQIEAVTLDQWET